MILEEETSVLEYYYLLLKNIRFEYNNEKSFDMCMCALQIYKDPLDLNKIEHLNEGIEV